jgi:hypothetical protein
MPEPGGAAPQPGLAYEARDANAGAIWAIGAVLVVATVVVGLCVWGMYVYFEDHRPRPSDAWNPRGARQSELPLNERLDEVPPPRLEGLKEIEGAAAFSRSSSPAASGNASETYQGDLYYADQQALNQYAWVDKENGIARIPINRAMLVALANGMLKSAPGARELSAAPARAGRPSNSNSGRGSETDGQR